MPREIPTYTSCAAPGSAKSHQQLGGIAGFLANAILKHKILSGLALLALLIGLILLSNPAAWSWLGILIILGLIEFKTWYYDFRLLCIRNRDCAIGTVISPPNVAFDGDNKLNLMLAPYSQRHWVETLLDHISTNEAMLNDDANFNDPPFHTSHPNLPTQATRESDFDVLRKYLKNLAGSDPDDDYASATMYRQLLIGVIDRVMADPLRNFYNRYYRKDPVHIPFGSPLWDAIPEDFDSSINWQAPNAHSTRTHTNPYIQKTDTLNSQFSYEISHLVPYIHCEIDGYYIKLLIDNLIMAFVAWIALLLALTAFFGPWAPYVAAFFAFLLYFLKDLYDKISGNNGDASQPDVDWDDPDVPGEGEVQRVGDVVVTYGNWIMDTEHHNYFEIHPVRAYYIIAHNSLGEGPVLVNGNMDQEAFGHENFDITEIDAKRAEDICTIISGAEEEKEPDPGNVIYIAGPKALSFGLTTAYGGGWGTAIR